MYTQLYRITLGIILLFTLPQVHAFSFKKAKERIKTGLRKVTGTAQKASDLTKGVHNVAETVSQIMQLIDSIADTIRTNLQLTKREIEAANRLPYNDAGKIFHKLNAIAHMMNINNKVAQIFDRFSSLITTLNSDLIAPISKSRAQKLNLPIQKLTAATKDILNIAQFINRDFVEQLKQEISNCRANTATATAEGPVTSEDVTTAIAEMINEENAAAQQASEEPTQTEEMEQSMVEPESTEELEAAVIPAPTEELGPELEAAGEPKQIIETQDIEGTTPEAMEDIITTTEEPIQESYIEAPKGAIETTEIPAAPAPEEFEFASEVSPELETPEILETPAKDTEFETIPPAPILEAGEIPPAPDVYLNEPMEIEPMETQIDADEDTTVIESESGGETVPANNVPISVNINPVTTGGMSAQTAMGYSRANDPYARYPKLNTTAAVADTAFRPAEQRPVALSQSDRAQVNTAISGRGNAAGLRPYYTSTFYAGDTDENNFLPEHENERGAAYYDSRPNPENSYRFGRPSDNTGYSPSPHRNGFDYTNR